MQRPPAYSAVKVGGRRAYELARAGEAVETKERPVTVYRAELLWHEGDRAAFEIECSAGTYVRTLVAELGDAYCDELERTAIGPFRLEDADPERIVPLGEALEFLPERVLDEREAAAVRHGRRIAGGGAAAAGEGGAAAPGDAQAAAVRLVHGDELLAVAEPRGDELQPVVVFAPA
jgi:tRNA pseudouridine55 synthase